MSNTSETSGGNSAENSTASASVAFIGLGNMGRRMAARLVAAGYKVAVFDTNPAAVQSLEEAGARSAGSPADAVSDADFILSSLPNPAIVEAVYLGSDGVLKGAKPGAVAADLSTIDPATAVSVRDALAQVNIGFLDAPVSRGVQGAENGTLAIMAGGSTTDFSRILPILQHLGSSITHVGESGTGQLVKLCNNMISAINTVAAAEVMVVGRRAGLDTKTMYDVLTSGSAESHILSSYFPRVVFSEERPTGFSLDFMVKDLDLFLSAANKTEVPMFLSGAVRQVFRMAQGQGLGNRDSCHVVEVYEQTAGVRLKFEETSSVQ